MSIKYKRSCTQARLRALLSYNPDTGQFKWLERDAGSLDQYGYRSISIDGHNYRAHRLAWLYVHGTWPEDMIDHANGVRDDNRICNLRQCNQAENLQNRSSHSRGKSGVMGALQHKHGKWQARINSGGRKLHIGMFDTAEEAHAAYRSAKEALHTFQPTLREPSSCDDYPAFRPASASRDNAMADDDAPDANPISPAGAQSYTPISQRDEE